MNFTYQHAQLQDLKDIMRIEHSGFSTAEAATTDAMHDRIKFYPDTFIVAKNHHAQVVGYIVGPSFSQRYLTDELYEKATPNDPHDPYQTVLSLVVAPHYQHRGIAGQLLLELAKIAHRQDRRAISLTCLAKLIPFYERHGYQNEGVAASDHAAETWYNMVLTLK